MEHQCDFESVSKFESREVAQISGLISDLVRIVGIIDHDIAAQEKDAGVRFFQGGLSNRRQNVENAPRESRKYYRVA
jgi:hypothetical protein